MVVAASRLRRKTAMRMLRNGEVTVTEAAVIALVSRQRVLEWCKAAGINPKTARQAKIANILQWLNRKEGLR